MSNPDKHYKRMLDLNSLPTGTKKPDYAPEHIRNARLNPNITDE